VLNEREESGLDLLEGELALADQCLERRGAAKEEGLREEE
jgi:hypothetical protein